RAGGLTFIGAIEPTKLSWPGVQPWLEAFTNPRNSVCWNLGNDGVPREHPNLAKRLECVRLAAALERVKRCGVVQNSACAKSHEHTQPKAPASWSHSRRFARYRRHGFRKED